MLTVAADVSPAPIPLQIAQAPVQSWSDPNDINGLLLDAPYLWAASGGGVVRWDTATGAYTLFLVGDGLLSQAVSGIAQDADGHIWVGYADHPGWSEFEGQQWVSYPSREDAVAARYRAMLRARQTDPRLWSARSAGTWLWLPSADGRAKAFDGERWRTYGEREGVRRSTRLVVISEQGRVWAIGEGVSTAEEGDRWWLDHAFFAGVPEGSTVHCATPDAEGGLWLAFAGTEREEGAVARLDADSGRWTAYQHSLNPAIPPHVYQVEIDAEGAIWLCGEQGIAYRRPGQPWQKVAVPPGLTLQHMQRNGSSRLWLGSSDGLWSVGLDGQGLQGPWRVPSPLLGSDVADLALVGNKLWVGTAKGVTAVEFSSGGRIGHVSVVTREKALQLAAAPDGALWMATPQRLLVMRQGATHSAFAGPVGAMAFDPQGRPWLCTEGGEILRWSGEAWQSVTRTASVGGVSVRQMAIGAEGTIWLATSRGLEMVTLDGTATLLTTAHGLPASEVNALALQPDGSLWVGTPSGLTRRSAAGRWTRLTIASTGGGLRSERIRDLVLERDGSLWVATAAGLSLRGPQADWAYIDLPGVRCLWPEPGGPIWVGTMGGLYRLERRALAPLKPS